jgi:hypothetical protein
MIIKTYQSFTNSFLHYQTKKKKKGTTPAEKGNTRYIPEIEIIFHFTNFPANFKQREVVSLQLSTTFPQTSIHKCW